jgi:nucleoid-associated protein YgaU
MVEGGNLYAIAARHLGDATQWIRIAELNGLKDPVVTGITTLVMPARNAAAGGGVASQ